MTKKAAPKKGKLDRASGSVQLQAWLAAKKGPVETAAYNKAKRRTANAWKRTEFQTALHHAVTLETMEPLAKFLESKTPLTQSDRFALARFLRSFEPPKVGRPRGTLNVAESNAVWWVRLGQHKWLEENKRQRVPASVTNELIAEAIDLASEAFKPRSKLSPDVISALVHKTSRKIID